MAQLRRRSFSVLVPSPPPTLGGGHEELCARGERGCGGRSDRDNFIWLKVDKLQVSQVKVELRFQRSATEAITPAIWIALGVRHFL